VFKNYLGRLPQGMSNHPLLKYFIQLILPVLTMCSLFEHTNYIMTKKQWNVISTLVLFARSVKEVFLQDTLKS
jgi:hypothetical protein